MLTNLLIIYSVGLFITLLYGGIGMFKAATETDRKFFAKLFILSFIWPLAFVGFAVYHLFKLLQHAYDLAWGDSGNGIHLTETEIVVDDWERNGDFQI